MVISEWLGLIFYEGVWNKYDDRVYQIDPKSALKWCFETDDPKPQIHVPKLFYFFFWSLDFDLNP